MKRLAELYASIRYRSASPLGSVSVAPSVTKKAEDIPTYCRISTQIVKTFRNNFLRAAYLPLKTARFNLAGIRRGPLCMPGSIWSLRVFNPSLFCENESFWSHVKVPSITTNTLKKSTYDIHYIAIFTPLPSRHKVGFDRVLTVFSPWKMKHVLMPGNTAIFSTVFSPFFENRAMTLLPSQPTTVQLI